MTQGLRLPRRGLGGIVLLLFVVGCQGTGKKLEASQPIKAWNPPTSSPAETATTSKPASVSPSPSDMAKKSASVTPAQPVSVPATTRKSVELAPPRLNIESARSVPPIRTIGVVPPADAEREIQPPVRGELIVPKVAPPTPVTSPNLGLESTSGSIIPPSPPSLPGLSTPSPPSPPVAGPASAPIKLGEK